MDFTTRRRPASFNVDQPNVEMESSFYSSHRTYWVGSYGVRYTDTDLMDSYFHQVDWNNLNWPIFRLFAKIEETRVIVKEEILKMFAEAFPKPDPRIVELGYD